MRLLTTLAIGLAISVSPTIAEDKVKKEEKEKELVGAFKRKAGDLDLKMTFKKDGVMVYQVATGDDGCTMTTKYTKEKDGTYKFEVTSFEKKGAFPVEKPVGYKFSFKVEVKGEKAVLSSFSGDDVDENAKAAIEGDYEKATD